MALLLALLGTRPVLGTVPVSADEPAGKGLPTYPASTVSEADARYQQALEAMRDGDYAEAFCQWKPLAEDGHAKAQFSLGWMYHNGYGLAIDNKKALDWWERAAAQGMANAAFALGLLFSNGDEDIDRDIALASRYLLQAARLKHGDAGSMLASLFELYPRKMRAISADWTEQEWSLVGNLLRVRVDRANLRAGPGLDQAILRVLDKGTRVAELSRSAKWVEVSLGGQGVRGWIYSTLLEPVPENDSGNVNMPRARPAGPRAGDANPAP